MPPNPIFVKLKVSYATAGTFCFLGRKNGANVNLTSVTGVVLADDDKDEKLPTYLVSELIYSDVLRKVYVSFKDSNGYLHSRPMLISAANATRDGLAKLVGETYKTDKLSGTIKKARQKRNRRTVD